MEMLSEDWQEQVVLRELLVESEVLIDLQFFMELCELFSVSHTSDDLHEHGSFCDYFTTVWCSLHKI